MINRDIRGQECSACVVIRATYKVGGYCLLVYRRVSYTQVALNDQLVLLVQSNIGAEDAWSCLRCC